MQPGTPISGKTHQVLTAYCLLAVARETPSRSAEKTVASEVTMRKLPETALKRYIHTGEPMDKAGAYAAQGLGASLIEGIRGSYTNVVGLPLCEVLTDLEKMTRSTPLGWIR